MDQTTSDLLTRTGPGTAMGNLMRRYWVPILASSEIAEPDGPQVRVQILGEKLLAFRDTEGQVGLYFDAKAIPPEALAEAIERHHLSDRTVVYQSPKYLAQLKAINPKIRALPPLGKLEDLPELAANLVRERKSLADVRALLSDAMVAADLETRVNTAARSTALAGGSADNFVDTNAIWKDYNALKAGSPK